MDGAPDCAGRPVGGTIAPMCHPCSGVMVICVMSTSDTRRETESESERESGACIVSLRICNDVRVTMRIKW